MLTRELLLLLLQKVCGAAHAKRATIQHVCVDHRSLHITMPHQFLDGADVLAAFQQVCGKRVAERVGGGRLC